jgi:hypothetical protein
MTPKHWASSRGFRIFLAGPILLFSASTSALAAEKHLFEAESAEAVGGENGVADGAASGGYLVGLSKPGQGVKFTGLPAASKLAIRYASMEVGTISVAVNDQPARKVKVHSMPLRLSHFVQGAHVAPLPGRWTKCANRISMHRSSSAARTLTAPTSRLSSACAATILCSTHEQAAATRPTDPSVGSPRGCSCKNWPPIKHAVTGYEH